LALQSLYHKLSPGGFVIIYDYASPECRAAVTAFRDSEGILDPVQNIDWTGAFWRKGASQ
jgi:hypothetical protein